jgi:hypothetical protein
VTLDPSGAVVPDVTLNLTVESTGEVQSTTSDSEGRFRFALLAPGKYRLQGDKPGFKPVHQSEITVAVTETVRFELRLQVATVVGSVQVSSEPQMVQSDDSALGRVVNERAVTVLPLVTRNFTQIAGLSSGVNAAVFNAGELGLGGTAQSQISSSNDGIFVHGSRSYDNNWQMDGVSVSDVQSSGSSSGGIPLPNPDTIQEFKVQTGLYDAAYGRYAGANVSVVTKIGGNDYHGTIFEFFRNQDLNANDFFFNETGHSRAALKQNQFGFTAGGPIKKDKLFFFGSYQGTRQVNGLAAGQTRIACAATLSEPPLTNDRSAAALGQLFADMSGALGGVAIQPDGSNINPVALALLNFKLPNGNYLIPTPQTINASRSLASQGFSTFSEPCHFSEDQGLVNVDYLISPKNKLSGRFFLANDNETVSFPGNGLNPSGNIAGFPSPLSSDFRVFSLSDSYTFSSEWLNNAWIGFVRNKTSTSAITPFSWSDVGVAESDLSNANQLPSLNILGSVSIASGYPRTFAQNTVSFGDNVSFVHGAHTLQFGGSVTRVQDNVNIAGFGSFLQFLSWPDFLLGLKATDNGTGVFSNVFASADVFGLLNREYRSWEAAAFVQDNYRINPRFTLNLGLRYERLGQFGDNLGRNSNFDTSLANQNPPASGSYAGYVVASNYSGPLPIGAVRASNQFATNGTGQNTIAPRVGFAWQVLPDKNWLLLRGGYGMYYSLPTGQAFFQTVFGAPFSSGVLNLGPTNANATFQNPFPMPFPTADSFPLFPAYSPEGSVSVSAVSPDFRPASVQEFSLNVQAEFRKDWLLEVGYVGARGIHLLRARSANQAGDASAADPIRGVTTNTVANIPLRVPILGIPADSLAVVESEGSSWYNGLEVSLTKRLSHGIQFLGSYTFSKTLDTDGAFINSTSAGVLFTRGNQNSPHLRWGRADFDHTNRFILSATWTLPNPAAGVWRATMGGWALAGIVTVQSGSARTVTDSNSSNVFGITGDLAELSGRCSKSQLVTGGSVESKLRNYFNKSCFTKPPVIGADGIGTGFGDSATGIVDGPGQTNFDLSLSKQVSLPWPREGCNLLFRADFFNAFNHPQFANPDSNFTSATFGVISSTSVNPRVIQFGLKWSL